MFENLTKWFKGFAAPDSSVISSSLTASSNGIQANFRKLSSFNLGIGTIGPANRNDIDQDTLNDLYQSISTGKFNIPVIDNVPSICVDGRTKKDGQREPTPSASGGTLSIVYGVDLAGEATPNDTSEIKLVSRIFNILKNKSHTIGVHGDDHTSCGCGACSKAKEIYQHAAEKIDAMAELSGHYGIPVSQQEKDSITQQAKSRINQQPPFFAEERSSILDHAQECGSIYEELVGSHNELAIVLNTRPGTTVDRSAIRAKFGPQYDIFVVDVWAFANAAKAVGSDNDQIDTDRIVKAITLQNIATASVLGHGSLPIIPVA